MARLRVVVTPRSGADELGGWRGDELVVRVTAAPDAGKANAAVCRVVAAAVGVPKSSVSVMRGHTARHKVLDVAGATDEEVERVVGRPGDSLF